MWNLVLKPETVDSLSASKIKTVLTQLAARVKDSLMDHYTEAPHESGIAELGTGLDILRVPTATEMPTGYNQRCQALP